jgi:hypothetical protein
MAQLLTSDELDLQDDEEKKRPKPQAIGTPIQSATPTGTPSSIGKPITSAAPVPMETQNAPITGELIPPPSQACGKTQWPPCSDARGNSSRRSDAINCQGPRQQARNVLRGRNAAGRRWTCADDADWDNGDRISKTAAIYWRTDRATNGPGIFARPWQIRVCRARRSARA